MTFSILLILALQPECEILMFMWSLGPLISSTVPAGTTTSRNPLRVCSHFESRSGFPESLVRRGFVIFRENTTSSHKLTLNVGTIQKIPKVAFETLELCQLVRYLRSGASDTHLSEGTPQVSAAMLYVYWGFKGPPLA